jgi:CRISPR-associated protein Cmr2
MMRWFAFLEDEIGKKPEEKSYANRFRDNHEDLLCGPLFLCPFASAFSAGRAKRGRTGRFVAPAARRYPLSRSQHLATQRAHFGTVFDNAIWPVIADNIGLMVFSLTPVQGFITTARKLRDYWSGSILLSWLAFEGLRWVMENLGPDHVLYPS